MLAASAYVSLCLNDHLMALRYAEQLLWQPRLSGAHRYVCHVASSVFYSCNINGDIDVSSSSALVVEQLPSLLPLSECQLSLCVL